jgi:hypothetical protein
MKILISIFVLFINVAHAKSSFQNTPLLSCNTSLRSDIDEPRLSRATFFVMNPFDIIGKRFGNLVVVKRHHVKDKYWHFYKCKCDCGGTAVFYRNLLVSGKKTHCGCLFVNPCVTHGLSHTPEYETWLNMVYRCTRKEYKIYKNYGGRGIKVCDRWLNSFENFYADMGVKPSQKHSLEREDNDGNYCPENCKWATRDIQNRNHRRNVNITYEGQTMCLTDWAKKLKINYPTLKGRISIQKLSFEQAVKIDASVHYTQREGFVKWSIRKRQLKNSNKKV